MMRLSFTKKMLIMFSLIVAAVTLSVLLWYRQEANYVQAVIIDKTVPNTSYREHKGLMWVLNNLKYVDESTREAFRYDEDYYGFVPLEGDNYATRDLPKKLPELDLVYLADTYGVYSKDLYTDNERGARSELIYGGTELKELLTIKQALGSKGLLLAEFNTLASPTEGEARAELESLLDLEWSGWIGRYFYDLSRDNPEIPLWLIENYERQYDKEWVFSGEGFAMVNSDDTVVILEVGKDVGENLLKVNFTEKAVKELKVSNQINYYYWFDIVSNRGGEVLANYELDLTKKGKEKLREYGIPVSFPAVLRSKQGIKSYYFAGDFSDLDAVPRFYQSKGIGELKGLLSVDMKGNPEHFYWEVYYPLLKSILKEVGHEN